MMALLLGDDPDPVHEGQRLGKIRKGIGPGQVMRSLGRGIIEFRKGVQGIEEDQPADKQQASSTETPVEVEKK